MLTMMVDQLANRRHSRPHHLPILQDARTSQPRTSTFQREDLAARPHWSNSHAGNDHMLYFGVAVRRSRISLEEQCSDWPARRCFRHPRGVRGLGGLSEGTCHDCQAPCELRCSGCVLTLLTCYSVVPQAIRAGWHRLHVGSHSSDILLSTHDAAGSSLLVHTISYW